MGFSVMSKILGFFFLNVLWRNQMGGFGKKFPFFKIPPFCIETLSIFDKLAE